MKIGLKVRFNDVHIIEALNPEVLEFHFSDKDLDVDYKKTHPDNELVIHAPEYYQGKLLDLCSISETNVIQSREKSIEVFKRTIEKSKEMGKFFKGTPAVIIHPGGYSMNPITSKEELEHRFNLLKMSFNELKTSGVEILFENLPPFPWFFGGQWTCNQFLDSEEIKKFCNETNSKICLDVSHLKLYCNHKQKDFFEEVANMLPYVSYVHISDATGVDGEGIQLEEGEINFFRLFSSIKHIPGLVIVPEIWQGHNNEAKGFKIALQRLEKYLK